MAPTPLKPPLLSGQSKAFWWVLILCVISTFFYAVRGILLPFVLGLIIAYGLSPLLDMLQRFKVPRIVGTLLILFLFFVGFIVFIILTIPYAQNEILALAQKVPSYGLTLHHQILALLEKVSLYLPPSEWQRLTQLASTYVGDIFKWVIYFFVNLISGGLALANLVALVIITPLVAFYFLKEWPSLIRTSTNLLPMAHRKEITGVFAQINEALGGFIRGQALVCFILAVYYSTSLSLIGLESGFVIGLLIGFFAFIPYIGFFSGFAVSMILAFIQFDTWTPRLLILTVFAIGQIVEGSFLTPKLVGDRIKLHPLWVVFAVFSGAYLLGFLGMLIALPVAAIVGVLIRYAFTRYLKSPLYSDKRK